MRSILVGLSSLAAAGIITLEVVAQQAPAPLPVDRLTPLQRLTFEEGSRTFSKNYEIADGLGPVFNDRSCNSCHPRGGGSNRTARRFGRIEEGVFDPLVEHGGSLIQTRGIGLITTLDGTHTFIGERTPAETTVTTLRRTTSTLGLGFVDAVPDSTWLAMAALQTTTTAGRAHIVVNLASGREAVGKFGWKAQSPTLLQFSGDALVNEIGITNPRFDRESCPQGDCDALAFNPAPALNDNGRDVAALADFMTMLAAPARGPITAEVTAGEAIFEEIGCGACHVSTLRTGPSAIAALNRVVFHPYSDFLLHDMGSLGDGIAQGRATGREMRTAPLWGLRSVGRLLHDRSANGIEEAILRHDGQGRAARDRFQALGEDRSPLLLAFLRSL
jgi:CxxC motif-containing protein (DUF1111 family)